MLYIQEFGKPKHNNILDNFIAIARIEGGKFHNAVIYLNPSEDIDVSSPNGGDKSITLTCPYCKNIYSRKDHLNRHIQFHCKILASKNYIDQKLYEIANLFIDKKFDIPEETEFFNNKLGKSLELKDDGIIVPLPEIKSRNCGFLAGPQGCGKSFWIAQYLKEYKNLYPKRKIYLFSEVDEDPSIDEFIEKENRLQISYDLMKKITNCKKFFNDKNGALVIFDDIDGIMDKKLKKYMEDLRDNILKIGRDQTNKGKNIDILCTNHEVCNNIQTKSLFTQSSFLVLYPKSGANMGNERAMRVYLGLGKKDIEKIKKLNSRSVMFYKKSPNYVLYNKGIYLLS